MASASRRLIKELTDLRKKPFPSHLSALHPVNEDDLLHWTATLLGPAGTPYAGGSWTLDIQVPEEYPQKPPAVRFVTPVCHANVHPKVRVVHTYITTHPDLPPI